MLACGRVCGTRTKSTQPDSPIETIKVRPSDVGPACPAELQKKLVPNRMQVPNDIPRVTPLACSLPLQTCEHASFHPVLPSSAALASSTLLLAESGRYGVPPASHFLETLPQAQQCACTLACAGEVSRCLLTEFDRLWCMSGYVRLSMVCELCNRPGAPHSSDRLHAAALRHEELCRACRQEAGAPSGSRGARK